MKTTTVTLVAALLLGLAQSSRAAETVNETLQKGLFEEEANHNLDAAIKAYQSVLQQTDEHRKLAATSVFRLGECYRKLGKTNEATAQYERVLREFGDQTTLADPSRQNLAGFGVGTVVAPKTGQFATTLELMEIKRIQAMIKDSPDLINARLGGGNTPLEDAAEKGQLVVARYLLDNGADVNAARALSGPTALQLAALAGHKSMVELLLAGGAKIQGVGTFTPLHEAASRGFKSVVELLLANHAEVNAYAEAGETPLHAAVERGFAGVAQVLLDHGANPNATKSDRSFAAGSVFGNRQAPNPYGAPLHYAAYKGDKAMIELLLSHQADVNAKNREGLLTPLHLAAYYASPAVASVLLAAKAEVNAQVPHSPKPGMAPLHFAVWAGRPEMVEFLLQNGADPNLPFDDDGTVVALVEALSIRPSNYEKIVELLLEHKADPNIKSSKGLAPLHYVGSTINNAILQVLLKHGADTELKDPEGKTALNHQAAKEIMDTLLESKANPNTQDNRGNTPLHNLVLSIPSVPMSHSGYFAELAELLLAHGAAVNKRNNEGKTPLNLMGVPASPILPAKVELAELLRKHGALDEMLEPEPDSESIRVWRKGLPSAQMVFARDSDGHNRYTLFETVLNLYSSSSPWPYSKKPGSASGPRMSAPVVVVPPPMDQRLYIPSIAFAFPDFTRIKINRPIKDKPNEKKVILVNLLDGAGNLDCSKDTWLEFGDVIEIQEREYRLGESKIGLTKEQEQQFTACLPRKVKVVVKGTPNDIELSPLQSGSYLSPALGIPNFQNALRSTSDLSRLKIKRTAVGEMPANEWSIDVESFRKREKPQWDDFWLRDGDVIEVPEK